jgi:Flp pilus assembly CpaE family ATPase
MSVSDNFVIVFPQDIGSIKSSSNLFCLLIKINPINQSQGLVKIWGEAMRPTLSSNPFIHSGLVRFG